MINYIESKDNPKIKNALKIASDASFRKKNGMFFASSSKAVGDIARAGFEPVALFLTGEEYERQGEKFAAYPVYVISSSVCEKLREGKTEDGVFGVFKMKPGGHGIKFYPAINCLFYKMCKTPAIWVP